MANEAKQFTIGGVTHDVMDEGARQLISSLTSRIDTLIGSGNAQGAIDTFNEITAFLNGIDTSDPTLRNKLLALNNAITTLQTTLANKANAADVYDKQTVDQKVANAGKVQSVSVNGGEPVQPVNGNVNIVCLTKDDFSVETQGDGTVDINVGSGAGKDTYTINLNHTHENMAKLIVVNDAEDLPSQLAADTIYGVSDGEEISVVYIGGLPFYGGGGGGGSTSPVLREPSANSTINVGTNTGYGVSKPIKVKGRNLTQDLTLELTGTGFAFDSTQATGVTFVSSTELTVSAAAANQTGGVSVVINYTGTSASATGQLEITSTGEINVTCSLSASYEVFSQSYSESEAKAAFQDSTLDNKWLKADASAIGSAPVYDSVQGAQGSYALKVPLAGIAVLRYPMFKTEVGYGTVICDANGNVVWQFANTHCSNGVMNTVDVANIAGASYALIQLFNGVTGYTIEISSDLYYGITYDKAAVNAGYVDAVGYCVSNGYPLVSGHVYKINAGFTQSPNNNNLFGLKILGDSGSSNLNLYSVDNNQDGNGIMSVTASSSDTYGKATFKTSELDNCYIYDNTAGLYLFKGKNVQ